MSVKSVKRPATSGILLAASAAVALATFDQSPAYANDAFLRGFVGGMVGGMVGNMLMQQRFHGGGYGHRPAPARPYSGGAASSHSRPGNGPPSPEESSRALASLAPPTTQEEQVILKSVTPGQSLGAVGATDDLDQIGKDYNADAYRDYTSRVDEVISRIQEAQSAQHSTKEGDVTEHAILEALNTSIHDAKLFRFETFLGENWSPERLRVMILDQVLNELGGLFDGTNRGAVTMNDLNSIISKSALNVYSRLFETSELLAANRSSTLFLQRLYQTHGDLVNGDVRESAEQLLTEASAAGVAPLDPSLRRDPNAFALRYRAERIIYDCLTDNVEAMTSTESGLAPSAEMNKHVLDVTNQQCAKWASAQLIDADGKVKPQEPMPLRVIWSAKGPNDDDPSMYGRATDL
ncbi:hypothetical protein [Roseiarcus sp.]|uniref:hypothetical protein n=1 Tax=Roseiarcus sp. TaxID=1969460 RepID=UPI003D11C092